MLVLNLSGSGFAPSSSSLHLHHTAEGEQGQLSLVAHTECFANCEELRFLPQTTQPTVDLDLQEVLGEEIFLITKSVK